MNLLDSLLDLVAFLYALAFFPAPFFWVIIHPFVGFWRRYGKRAFWVALPVWFGSGVGLWWFRNDMFAQRLDRNAATWTLGAALVLLGVYLTRRVRSEFSLRRLAGFPELDPARYPGGVVRSGIYARLRHPRYMGFVVTLLGLSFLTGAVGIFVLAIITVLMYLIVAPLEERELRDHYGAEYEAYTRDVPRFFPRLRRRN